MYHATDIYIHWGADGGTTRAPGVWWICSRGCSTQATDVTVVTDTGNHDSRAAPYYIGEQTGCLPGMIYCRGIRSTRAYIAGVSASGVQGHLRDERAMGSDQVIRGVSRNVRGTPHAVQITWSKHGPSWPLIVLHTKIGAFNRHRHV